MEFNRQIAHDLAIAFATAQIKETFKPDPKSEISSLEQQLSYFEGLYINAFQFFSRNREI